VNEIGAWFSPHNWFWRDIEQYIVPSQFKNKKVALIFGKDKPSLFSGSGDGILNGFYFRDTPCMSYADIGQSESIKRINFYWDPDNTNILIKQLHVLRRMYELHSNISYNHIFSVPTIGGVDINNIVYNLKKPLLYKSPKSKSNLISIRDNYLKGKQNSDVFFLYQSGLKRIDREVGALNMVPILSRFYSILGKNG
jgi:hypothetical protein